MHWLLTSKSSQEAVFVPKNDRRPHNYAFRKFWTQSSFSFRSWLWKFWSCVHGWKSRGDMNQSGISCFFTGLGNSQRALDMNFIKLEISTVKNLIKIKIALSPRFTILSNQINDNIAVLDGWNNAVIIFQTKVLERSLVYSVACFKSLYLRWNSAQIRKWLQMHHVIFITAIRNNNLRPNLT